jgi:phosphopantetheinyl transferase (holo-ACP synthase)
MTHSGSLAAIAITVDCQIGLDLEQVCPLSDMQQVATHFFCSEETAEIMSLPPSERERAFFCCWTRKEAYIKAIGDGLSAPLDGFRVTVLPDTPAQFVRIGPGATDTDAWTLHESFLGTRLRSSTRILRPPTPAFYIPDYRPCGVLQYHVACIGSALGSAPLTMNYTLNHEKKPDSDGGQAFSMLTAARQGRPREPRQDAIEVAGRYDRTSAI